MADTIAMGVNPATVCSDLLKPGGYGRLQPMLRELAKAIRDSGAHNLTDWRQACQKEAVAGGHPSTAAKHVDAILHPDGVEPYHLRGNEKLPRAVDHDLEMFGCVACNFCVTVCPNDAFFSILTPDWLKEDLGDGAGRQQYMVLSELCNECGNCMTFCPEEGDPAVIKPRLYTDADLFAQRSSQGQSFLLSADGVVGNLVQDDQVSLVDRLLATTKGNPLR